ncbi:hypothetical protein ACSLOU_00615 [Enterobacter cloacae]|uniref:hypothetical protein n=1 Tax=Enterobacter cloacae TaxID=550 RepID=UPI003EE0AE2C
MKTMQYIQTLMFTLAAASSMTKEQMMKSHATITAEEPCFGLAPKDMRTRAAMLAAFQRQIDWMVDFDHGVALVMDAEFNAEKEVEAQREEIRSGEWVKEINAGFNKENAENIAKLEGMLMGACADREADHAEALEMNTQVDIELAKLCRVIAGVRRTSYKQKTKMDLIGAACRGVLDGLRERLGVAISRKMLPEVMYRAGKLAEAKK